MPERPAARRVPAGAGDLSLADYGRGNVPDSVGRRWSADELREEFEVIGFQAPYVMVRRLADGAEGTLESCTSRASTSRSLRASRTAAHGAAPAWWRPIFSSMKIVFSQAERDALEAALAEYGFSLEAGGANDGDEAAELHYLDLSQLSTRIHVDAETEVSAAELDALRQAAMELSFSTDGGGANDGDERVEAQVLLLEKLLGRAERLAGDTLV